MFKKTLSLFLAAVMCVCAFSFIAVSGADYQTYSVNLTDNGDGTATVTVSVPAGVSSGKIVVTTSPNMAYIKDSAVAGTPNGVVNSEYSRDGISGICVTFASANVLPAGTVVFTAKFKIINNVFLSADDISAPLWNLTNGDERLGTDADGDVTKSYTPAYYTVKFVGLNGVLISETKVERGKAATAPAAPVVEGYDFIGWDSAFNSITADTTISAIYKIKTFTVTFVAESNGTLNGATSVTVNYGTPIADVPHPTPVPDIGYIFAGFDITEGTVTSDITITAKFVPDYLLGDVNNDGLVDNMDASRILRYDAGILDFSEQELLAADVNFDGIVDNADAAMILKYDAGIIDEF